MVKILTDVHMVCAASVAIPASTEAGKTKAGWVRLARVASLTEPKLVKPYVIAVRQAKDDNGIHFGCSCPDWVYRKRHEGGFCKHQKAFLAHMKGTSPAEGIWLYNSGEMFLRTLAAAAAMDQFSGLKLV